MVTTVRGKADQPAAHRYRYSSACSAGVERVLKNLARPTKSKLRRINAPHKKESGSSWVGQSLVVMCVHVFASFVAQRLQVLRLSKVVQCSLLNMEPSNMVVGTLLNPT